MSTALDWPSEKFADVLEIRNGRNQREVENTTGPYPIYGSGGVMGYASDYICEANTTIIGRKGSINNPLYVKERFWTVDTAFGLHPTERLHPRFLYYYCLYYDFSKHNRGTTIPSLVKTELLEIRMPLPPIPEQQRIVGKLDAAFAALAEAQANVERNRANTRELFESYLNGVFKGKGDEWVEKSLQDICDVRDGTHASPKYHTTGYALVTSKNLKPDGLELENVSLINEDDFNEINRRSKVDKGDVLFAMIGTIGNPTVIEDEPNFAIKNVALFKCGATLDGRFLRYTLLTSDVKERMRNEAKGTTQRFVGLGYLRAFRIVVPTLREQQHIVSELDALNEKTKQLEATYQQKLTELAGLKKAVLGAAFRGEL